MTQASPSKPDRNSVPAMPMKDAALIQSAPVAMPLKNDGTRRPAT